MSHEPYTPTEQEAIDQSPLREATDGEAGGAASIQELMSRDPLDLTRQDLAKVVRHFRATRKAWEQEESKPRGKRSAKAKAAAKPKPTAQPGLSLGDLGL